MNSKQTMVDPTDKVQAATRLAKAAVGDADGSGILVRRVHIEVEPSGEPRKRKRKPITELPTTGLTLLS